MKVRFLVIVAVIVQLCGLAASQSHSRAATRPNPADSPIYITHVTVIDTKTGGEGRDRTVIILGDRVSEIKKSKSVKAPAGAKIVDGTGKYLIPGLWDMHVHIFNNESGRPPNESFFGLFVANGVTGIREMWTKREQMGQVLEWRKRFGNHTLLAPRIASVGTVVDGPNPVRSSDVVATVAEARQIVRTIKASGVDFVKVYTELRPDEYFAIADEARKENIPFAGHVPYRIDAGEASDAGQRSIEHLTNILESCSTKEQKWLHSEKWDFRNDREMLDSYDDSKCRRLFSKFAKNNTWQVPTLILHLRRTATDVSKLPNDLPLKYLPAETREQPGWKMYMARQSSISQEEREVSQRKWAAILKIVREMHEAGVQFMTGTDVDNPYVYPGFSLHDELALLVEAGLTPAEALRTATLNPTRYMGLQKDLGTVAEDNFADLVLLEANPLDDIHNTRKITAVVLNGMYLNRADLDRILAGAGNQ